MEGEENVGGGTVDRLIDLENPQRFVRISDVAILNGEIGSRMDIGGWFRRVLWRARRDRFTDRSRAVMALANRKALERGAPGIGPEHVLAALIEKRDGVGIALLRFVGVSVADLRPDEVVIRTEAVAEPMRKLPLEGSMKEVTERAIDAAFRLKDDHVGTEHLVIGMADSGMQALVESLAKARVAAGELGNYLLVFRIIGAGPAAQLAGKWREAIAVYRRVLSIMPGYRLAANNLAWTLATCPDDSVRSGKEALRLMQWVESEAEVRKWWNIGTLAAAYAECGRFEEATKWGRLARQLATGDFVARWGEWLEGFKKGKAVRERMVKLADG